VYKLTIFDRLLRIKLWGLFGESAYTQVMPHSHTLTARVSAARTISRPLGLRAGVGACAAAVGPHTDCCCCGCIPGKSSTVTWHHSNTHTPCTAIIQPSHTRAVRCHAVTCTLAVVVVVYSLTLMHYQCTDLGYLFVTDFHYPLICVTNFCHVFGPRNGGWLIREYIR